MRASLLVGFAFVAAIGSGAAAQESSLGAIPPYEAISKAQDELGAELAPIHLLDASIAPLHGGWCVTVRGIGRTSGEPYTAPVFVQQDGTAWRTDAAGRKKYDGGADGWYAPPGYAADCKPLPPPAYLHH